MQPNLDAPPTVEAELAALRRLLDYGESTFSSSIAVCNSPVERDRLIENVRETHPDVAVVTIPPRTVDVFGFAIEGYTGPPKALFLIGLEASIASQEADSHTLRSLNASRDLWPNRYPCPIVLWLPEYAATALSQQARDYWRFISHRFYFATESPMLIARSNDTYADTYTNITSLSRDEKVARIAELKSRIESAGVEPVPALLQHVMVWWDELAVLYKFTGDYDESTRIRREEELPVYERLGDVRSKAVTMGKIADILHQRGQTDEALRLYREECLPAYERLSDGHSKAVTMGKIADIFYQRGQNDEALRIRREDQLPEFERRNDVRSIALTMGKIANIFQRRGQFNEALRIRREEELPVYERLGDGHSKAVTMGKIADIFYQRGQNDEALRIRREEELPIYERLGEVRVIAVTLGKIADILQQQGDVHESIRIYREILPTLERISDIHSLIICRFNLGMALLSRGYKKDIPLAREHLRWALATAEKHQYAEAAQIRETVTRLLGEH